MVAIVSWPEPAGVFDDAEMYAMFYWCCFEFKLTWLNLMLAWISNYIAYKLWGELTYPFTNVNGTSIEIWEWASNLIN